MTHWFFRTVTSVSPACSSSSHRILSLRPFPSLSSLHTYCTSFFSLLGLFLPFCHSPSRKPATSVRRPCYLSFLSLLLFSPHHLFLREQSVTAAAAAKSAAEASEELFETDLPFSLNTPLPESPTLYQEERPLPFLREKTLFLIANEPVLESHVASNLLHQLLYALQIPNEHVWLLDEVLLQGPQNEKFATLLPWLVYTYYNLPQGVDYIWIGTAYSRVVGPALEDLLRRLRDIGTSQQQPQKEQEKQQHGGEEYGEIPPQGVCIGFGLKDVTPSPRHHYYSDPDFIYPFLSAGILVDRRFLHFLAHCVRTSADATHEQQQQQQSPQGHESTRSTGEIRKTVKLLPRIEIDPIHELFKFLYDKHKFLLTHSDLFCPDNPMPRSLDRTETPYPAPHRRLRRPSPARTLFDIRGRSSGGTNEKTGDSVVEEEKEKKDSARAAELAALRKAEADIQGCVSFTVGSRHSPILSHQFFDRLMEYEEEKIARKEKLTQKLPIDSLLEPGSPYEKVEDEILNERPFFIVEPEDVFVAVKTHDANLERRLPLLKELWASGKVLAAAAKKRAQQSQHVLPFSDVPSAGGEEEELQALEDNMQQLRIVFFADGEAAYPRGKMAEGKGGQATERIVWKEEEATAGGRGVADAAAGRKAASGEGSEGKVEGGDEVRGRQDMKKERKKGREEQERERIKKIVGDSLVRVPVPFPNEKRSLCEKVMGILRHFYFKEKDRKFLVVVDDDTLLNVRHLLDLISLSLQPPIPARIFFRQALTDGNAIRQAHAPYQKLAAAIDAFMLPWKREHALRPSDFPAAPAGSSDASADAAVDTGTRASGDGAVTAAEGKEGQGSTSRAKNEKNQKGERDRRKQIQQQLRERQSASSALARSYAAAAYAQTWKRVSASAAAASAAAASAAAASAITPLYVGERYSFGHTAARSLRPGNKGKRTSSSSSSKEDSSSRRHDECRDDGESLNNTAEGEAARKKAATTGERAGGAGSSYSSSPSPSSLSSAPFAPSSMSVVNELFSFGGYSYITGGGGIVLDRAAVRLLLECPRCKCPADGTADDMLLGLWLQRVLGVPSLHASAFHQERPQDYHAAHLRQITPLSFHRFDRDVETCRREFHKYLDIGEGLNVGKFEEDDFQSIDWVDHDWQQVEDLLWHEADDDASDWLLHEDIEEEEEETVGRGEGGEGREEEREKEKKGEKSREEGKGDGGKEKRDAWAEGDETRAGRKRKKSRERKIGSKEIPVDFPSLIQQILNDAAETEGAKGLSSEEVARRLEKRAEEIDSEGEIGSEEKDGGRKEKAPYTEEEIQSFLRQEEL